MTVLKIDSSKISFGTYTSGYVMGGSVNLWASSSVVSTEEKYSRNATKSIFQLNSFKQLENDWDGNGAYAPTLSSIERSVSLVESLDRLRQEVFFIAPSPMGEILLELQNQCNSIEFYISSEGEISYTLYREDEEKGEGILASLENEDLNKILLWINIALAV